MVLDVNSGDVLASASYPTYSLATFSQDYNDLAEDPLKPLLNRALQGLYPPGSTFKMITAIAALELGLWSPTPRSTTRVSTPSTPVLSPVLVLPAV